MVWDVLCYYWIMDYAVIFLMLDEFSHFHLGIPSILSLDSKILALDF